MKEQSDSKGKYSEDYIIAMLEFLLDNIFVVLLKRFSCRYLEFQWKEIAPSSFSTHKMWNSYTVFALDGKVSVQFHVNVHR